MVTTMVTATVTTTILITTLTATVNNNNNDNINNNSNSRAGVTATVATSRTVLHCIVSIRRLAYLEDYKQFGIASRAYVGRIPAGRLSAAGVGVALPPLYDIDVVPRGTSTLYFMKNSTGSAVHGKLF